MKNNNIIKLLFILIIIKGLGACKKYEYFQTNPNQPSTATPALLLTDICYNTFFTDPLAPSYAARHMTYFERLNENVQYSWSSASYNAYDILLQVQDMDELATQSGQDNYRGLAKFFRAFHFSQLTETFGDIPYNDALAGKTGNVNPKYDAQKEVYSGILKELDDANTLLDAAKGTIEGDIIYGGDAGQWKKLVNAFKLRLLVHLSKKEADASLNIKAQFQAIISDPDKYLLMASNADNAQIVFNTSAPNNYYPTYGYNSFPGLATLEKGFVSLLKSNQDPRLFSIATPAPGGTGGVYSDYTGVDAGASISNQIIEAAAASKIAERYYTDKVNEPLILLGYAEQEFLIAEAISRNWITGTAQEHYENAVTASMQFYNIADAEITTYLSGANVTFINANALSLIATQKYISMFLNSGWEPFFEQRRTGIPVLSVGAGTANGGMVPKRWLYPTSEYNYNADNVKTAVQSQYSGTDDINKVMWLLQ